MPTNSLGKYGLVAPQRGLVGPRMAQPMTYEAILDGLRRLPVRVEGNPLSPLITGDIPLNHEALLRLQGKPGFGFASILRRF